MIVEKRRQADYDAEFVSALREQARSLRVDQQLRIGVCLDDFEANVIAGMLERAARVIAARRVKP